MGRRAKTLREIYPPMYEEYRCLLDFIYSKGMSNGDHWKLKEQVDDYILNLLRTRPNLATPTTTNQKEGVSMTKYMKIREQFFDDRVADLRLNKWQIPMKSDPKIKGLTIMYFYPEKVVEEFIVRLKLAAGLENIKLPAPTVIKEEEKE